MPGRAGALHVPVNGYGYALGRIAEEILVIGKGRGRACEAEAEVEALVLGARQIEIGK